MRIAAIVPCHNEAGAIGKVVRELQAAVPAAEVYVYDNRSDDNTADVARAAGAIVRFEERKGKGNVVRRAFADIDADVYLLIDGDDTYDAAAAPQLIEKLLEGPYDQVTGVRRPESDAAYRSGHALGNRFFNGIVGMIFAYRVDDMLSGYRVFSKRFVRSFPALSRGFEIETELTVHSISARIPQAQLSVGFRDRAEGTESKLRTYHDGQRILRTVLKLALHERPVQAYGMIAALLAAVALILGVPIVVEFISTGLVPRLPTALLASSLMILSGLALIVGMLMDVLRKIRDESSRLAYLSWEVVGHVR
ncbi:glycosyltransferase [Arthrobacter agilis]|nr:glycosyltransferase family 2 protein [Arthrobacter agilis]OUM41643.1 glycosyl transferase [Arthrobacter agilis]PPB46399.1 glycosyl transferase [Arthrobacter agilis]TPV27112.1 glycosyltransferase [Arthrobacter agilis]